MKTESKLVILVLVSCLVLLNVLESSAKPYTDIRKLPSITTDTLYPVEVEDSATSESMNLFRNVFAGTQLFQNQIRPKRQEARYVTLFRLPWRIARSMSQTGFGVAKAFSSAFADQFVKTYQQMQESVIPQASSMIENVWSSPPKPNLETAWLEGGV